MMLPAGAELWVQAINDQPINHQPVPAGGIFGGRIGPISESGNRISQFRIWDLGLRIDGSASDLPVNAPALPLGLITSGAFIIPEIVPLPRGSVRRHVLALTRKRQSTLEGSPFARDIDRYIWALDGGPEMDREVQSTLDALLRAHGRDLFAPGLDDTLREMLGAVGPG